MTTTTTHTLLCLALSVGLLACGGGPTGAFTPMFPDNEPTSLAAVLTRVNAAPASSDAPLAAALGPEGLTLFDVAAGSVRWTRPIDEARGEPHLAGDLVVLHEGASVVARRTSDGNVAFRVPDDRLSLVGAGGEGPVSAMVLSTTGGVGAQSHVIIARAGSIQHDILLEGSVGRPDVRGGLVFVAWGSQNVSVIDAATGDEVARLRSLAGVVSHVRVDPHGILFGQTGAGRFAPSATGDAESVGWYDPDVSRLPGSPPMWRSAYEPPASPTSATHKIRLIFAAASGDGALTFTDDSIYLTFYRFVFALAPNDLSVRWVHQHGADVVGAAAFEGGVMIADVDGGLTTLGTDGSVRGEASLGVGATVVALRLGSHRPAGGASGNAPSIGDQLMSAVQNTDARLVPGRLFAVAALAVLEGGDATGRLIALCDDRALPAPVREEACASVATRADGAEPMLAALGRHASFLAGTSAPDVSSLAQLAATLGERRAVPLLVTHLEDPATPTQALVPLADAFSALGDETAVAPLRDFLWLYHAEPADDELSEGLASVARAILHLSGPTGRETVQEVINAPFTNPATHGMLSQVLVEAEEAAQRAAEAEAAASAPAEGDAAGDESE